MHESGWPTLVVVCKRPTLGIGKQRLAVHLGAEATCHIAEALLACAMEDARNWLGPVVIAPANAADYDWAHTLSKNVNPCVNVLPQISGNLGQRLNGLDATLRCKETKQLIYMGSDAPGLCKTDFLMVKNTLQNHDTVLIPAVDGGVVLMASNQPWPDLAKLPWSTHQLGAELVSACQMEKHTVKLLPQGFDVDEIDDLKSLKSQLVRDRRPARQQLYTLVHQVLNALE